MRTTLQAVIVILSLMLTSPAFAKLNVVATLPWIGNVAQEIGGNKVTVTTLVKPSQDPHFLEAKPSMILAARRADVIMYQGLDLEIGYLPIIIEQSRNPLIMPGRPGNLDCSRFVNVIEKHAVVERSMGDIHPLGNPHYNFSPTSVLRVAEGMTNVLAGLDRTNAEAYRSNFKAFAARFEEKRKQWNRPDLKGKRYVAYHHYFEYLAADYGFRIVEYVEPKPGIPPSAAHIEKLVSDMRSSKPDGILVTPSYGMREAEALSARTGVKVIVLPQDVGAVKGIDDWFAFMDTVLAALR
jgi:zinc/manganese transport system substrate-binding protein